MSGRHPDLDAEQAYFDFAHASLELARQRATRIMATVEVGRGGTHQARVEWEALLDQVVNRLTALDLGERSLLFGRLDPADSDERYYIGRVGLWDEEQRPIVIDWRAPVAEPFYRATGRQPMGLRRRRYFASRGNTLLAIDDDDFGEPARLDRSSSVSGGSALQATLESPRRGRLSDVVATIQAEQDEVIRSPLAGLLLVKGGPGTGKTVVALHRAAYLLYSHRFPLQDQGVLVIGPNRLFLAYIEQVLPSLGEAGVEPAILADLLRPRVRVNGLDDEASARLKGDPRMVSLLARALQDRQRRLRQDLVIGLGLQRLRLSAAESARIVTSARRRSRSHNAGRGLVESAFYSALAASARRPVDPAVVREHLSDDLAVREALEWIWPVLNPAQLLHDLYGSKALLRSANRGRYTDSGIGLLHRPKTGSSDAVVWTFQDVPLLDELQELLGPRPGRRQEDEMRTYGHICVDEAQDLSPMELRMISRRSLDGSMTVVGDMAQATGSWAHDDWDSVLELLPNRRGVQHRELTVGYRIPERTMTLAARVLPLAAQGLQPPTAVRTAGDEPRIIDAGADIGAALAAAVATETEAVGEGNVAVLAPDSLYEEVRQELSNRGVQFGGPSRSGLDQQVAVVPVRLVKGLEVDAVIVVEPARIIDEERQGFRSLYVALTRATRRVTVLHRERLPEVLRGRDQDTGGGEAA